MADSNQSTTPGATWDTLVGGLSSEVDLANQARTGVRPPKGIFAAFPGATPKYATNTGEQDQDFRETMARMFLPVPDRTKFLEEFKKDDNLNQIAQVLGGQASDQGTSGGAGYVDFLLQNVQHSFQEKVQVVEVLADDHVAYVFGQAAPTFSYSGTLINTKQDDQAANMLRLYQNFGRGTQLAARNTLISLKYDRLYVSGVMLNLNMSLNAETEMAIPFSFNLLVKKFQLLPNPDSGLVSLSTPFAVKADQYLPFDVTATGNSPPDTGAPTATTGGATAADTKPAGTAPTTAEQEAAASEKAQSLVKRMQGKTTWTVDSLFKFQADVASATGG